MKNQLALLNELKRDEGLRYYPYRDSEGELTIGYGRCLSTHGIDDNEANYLLQNDVAYAEESVRGYFSQYDQWPTDAQHVVVACTFNLGVAGFRKFKKCIKALREQDWSTAAEELLDSLAARELPQRYQRYADKLRRINENHTERP